MASSREFGKSLVHFVIALGIIFLASVVDGISLRKGVRNGSKSNHTFFPSRQRVGRARLGGPSSKLGGQTGQCGLGKVNGLPGGLLASDRSGRIVGGFPATTPIPWQASLEVRESNGNWKHICGAALISQHHVLTASHCIMNTITPDIEYRVRLGMLHREGSMRNDDSIHQQIFYIRDSDITTHRQFGYGAEYGNDIAILKLQDRNGKGARLTEYVQPICIPDHEGWEFKMIPQNANCIVSGWGSTTGPASDDTSASLRVAAIPLQKHETCKRLYDEELHMNDFTGGNFLRRRARNGKMIISNRSKDVKGYSVGYGSGERILKGMLCAGPLSGRVDSGRGDSGGPLACEFKGRYYLVGIVSWGQPIGNHPTPGVYTRVSHYLDWINTEILLLGPT